MSRVMKKQLFHPKDPGSAITHFIGMVLVAFAMIPLFIHTLHNSSGHIVNGASMLIFSISMLLLYTASTVYHTFDLGNRINCILKKCDHMMIFIMIAGSYTPVCLIVLHNTAGYAMCALVWTMAFIGIIVKGLWINCPKWFSSVIYIGMGWTCLFAFSQIIHNLPFSAFILLLAGGILYTVGGVIYALKLKIFNERHKNFGSHEIFHIFVMLGSICHYIMMYAYVAHM